MARIVHATAARTSMRVTLPSFCLLVLLSLLLVCARTHATASDASSAAFVAADGSSNATVSLTYVISGSARKQFAVPSNTSVSVTDSAYAWQNSSWSACPVECGFGMETRTVSCVDLVTGSVANSSASCDNSTEPTSEQACYIDCPGTELSSFTVNNSTLSTFSANVESFIVYQSSAATVAVGSAVAANSSSNITWIVQSIANLAYPDYQELSLNVTSKAGLRRSYVALVLKEPSTDASLGSLDSTAGVWTQAPNASTLATTRSYSLALSYGTTNVSFVAAAPNNSYTTILSWSPPEASTSMYVPVLPNKRNVTVTTLAADGNTTRTYSISVWRVATWNSSSILVTPSSGTLQPTFNGTKFQYSLSVRTTNVTFTASVSSSTSGVKTVVVWRPASAASVLPVSPSTAEATVAVTTSSGQTAIYVVTVSRASTTVVVAPTVSITGAPTSVTIGSTMTLTAKLLTVDSLTTSLTYTWSGALTSDSTKTVDLTTTGGVLLSTAGSATLKLNTTNLNIASYTWTVTVADSDSTHLTSSGVTPAASASATVPVVSFVVSTSKTVVDPCSTSSPCLNDGVCSATVVASTSTTTTYVLSCTCTTTPYAYYGPTCSFGLLSCDGCVTSYSGGTNLTLYGVGLDSILGLSLAGYAVSASRPLTMNATTSTSTTATSLLASTGKTSLQSITFLTPTLATVTNSSDNTTDDSSDESTSSSLTPTTVLSSDDQWMDYTSLIFATTNPVSSYKVLTLSVVLATTTVEVDLNYTSLVYYSSSTCLAVGEWQPDGAGGCTSCPTGGYCPGGGRCWPLAGYWSYTEYQAPLSCIISDACPGVTLSSTTTASDSSSDGTTDTELCSTGYTGTRCSQCADGYYQLSSRCYYCGSSTDQSATLALTIIIALLAMSVLALGVAFLPSIPLAYAVQLFVVLQAVAQIGVDGASEIPVYTKTFTTLFTYLNLINFDLEILKPGCSGVPTFTFVTKFWYTILFMLFVALLFIVACFIRLCIKVCQRAVLLHYARGDDDAPFEETWIEDEADDGEKSGEKSGEPSQTEGAAPKRARTLYRQATMAQLKAFSFRAAIKRLTTGAPWVAFKQRLQHAILILLSIFYQQLAVIQFKAFLCETAPDPSAASTSEAVVTYSLYLTEDLQTLCYKGSHLGTVIFIAFLLPGFTIGFPLICFIVLTRAFASQNSKGFIGYMWKRFRCLRRRKKRVKQSVQMDGLKVASPTTHAFRLTTPATERAVSPASPTASEPGAPGVPGTPAAKYLAESEAASTLSDDLIRLDRINRYGYLFVNFRSEYFAWCILAYVVNLWTALVTVYAGSTSTLSMFLVGVMWSWSTFMVATELPYQAWTDNLQKVIIGLGTLAHSTVLLAAQSDGTRSAYFYVLIVAFASILALAMARHRLPCLRCRRSVAAVEYGNSQVEEIRRPSQSNLLKPRKKSISVSSVDSGKRNSQVDMLVPQLPVEEEEEEEMELASPSNSVAATIETERVPPEELDPEAKKAAELAAELALIAAEDAAADEAAGRADSVVTCALPPTLLHLLCRSLASTVLSTPIESRTASDLRGLVASALADYRRAAQHRLTEIAVESQSSAANIDSTESKAHADMMARVARHIESLLAGWQSAMDGSAPGVTPAEFTAAVDSLLASQEFQLGMRTLDGTTISSAVVQHMRVFESLVPILMQMSAELKANRDLLASVQADMRQQAEAAEQKKLQDHAEKVLRPTELDTIIDAIGESQSEVDSAADADPDGTAELQALRATAAEMVANDLQRAKESADQFAQLYQDLVDPAASSSSQKVRVKKPLDDALLEKIKEGRSRKQQRLLDAAFDDDALRAVFLLFEQQKQRIVDENVKQLAFEEAEQKTQEQREEAERRLKEKAEKEGGQEPTREDIAAELSALVAEADATAAASLQAEVASTCSLPPSLLQLLCNSLSAALASATLDSLSATDIRDLIASALADYRRASQDRLVEIQSSSGGADSTESKEHVETMSRVTNHIESLLEAWQRAIDGPADVISPASLATVIDELLNLPEFQLGGANSVSADASVAAAAVQHMSSFESLAPILVQIHAELQANRALLAEVAARLREQAEAAEQKRLREIAEKMVQPTELDAIIETITTESEKSEEGVVPADAEGAVVTTSSSTLASDVSRELLALKTASVQLVQTNLKRANESVDQFAKLYRDLVETTVATNFVKKDERSKADDAMMAKLKRGKTTKQQKVIDAAFKDAAMLQVFQNDERDKQEKAMQVKIRLRQEKKARELAEKTTEAQRRLDEKARAQEQPPQPLIIVEPTPPAPGPDDVTRIHIGRRSSVMLPPLESAPRPAPIKEAIVKRPLPPVSITLDPTLAAAAAAAAAVEPYSLSSSPARSPRSHHRSGSSLGQASRLTRLRDPLQQALRQQMLQQDIEWSNQVSLPAGFNQPPTILSLPTVTVSSPNRGNLIRLAPMLPVMRQMPVVHGAKLPSGPPPDMMASHAPGVPLTDECATVETHHKSRAVSSGAITAVTHSQDQL